MSIKPKEPAHAGESKINFLSIDRFFIEKSDTAGLPCGSSLLPAFLHGNDNSWKAIQIKYNHSLRNEFNEIYIDIKFLRDNYYILLEKYDADDEITQNNYIKNYDKMILITKNEFDDIYRVCP